MERAVELARRGWGRVHPNPLVGAVVVRGGEVVGEGFHGEYGGPHAEIVALAAAGARARGATLYVTLEPCAHHGKTPPCVDAIRRAGVARVVVGARDPNPQARGGADRLRAAGVEVVIGVDEADVREQNAAFFHSVERSEPYVVLKYGLSLDARLSGARGEATEVTAEDARAEVHRLRAGFDAVLVGIRTVLVDDPLLTVRGDVVPRVPPVRLVADTDARLPVGSRLVRTAADAPVWLLCAEDAPAARARVLQAHGVKIVRVPRGRRGIALDAALKALRAEGLASVFCEGGGRLGTAMLMADRVERLYLFYAPRLFGSGGVAAFAGRIPKRLRSGWKLSRVEPLKHDVLVVVDRVR